MFFLSNDCSNGKGRARCVHFLTESNLPILPQISRKIDGANISANVSSLPSSILYCYHYHTSASQLDGGHILRISPQSEIHWRNLYENVSKCLNLKVIRREKKKKLTVSLSSHCTQDQDSVSISKSLLVIYLKYRKNVSTWFWSMRLFHKIWFLFFLLRNGETEKGGCILCIAVDSIRIYLYISTHVGIHRFWVFECWCRSNRKWRTRN